MPAAGRPGVEAPAPAPGPSRGNGLSTHARRVLEGSRREAQARGDETIRVEHVLLALLNDSRNGAVQTLEALRATPAQVRRQLEHEWAGGAGA